MKKVCVVMVTFNRKEYLEKLLNSFDNQTSKIDSILLVDNHSNDGTDEFLLNNNYIKEIKENKLITTKKGKKNYLYFRTKENLGGAGGFNQAFKIVKTLNFDYIWVMDDDVLPENDCLEKLLKYQSDKTMITIPNRTKNGYVDVITTKINLSNPFKIFMKKKTSVLATDINPQTEVVDIVDMPFEGPLINTNLIKKVGLPDSKYFLQFDDTDYATRSLSYTNIQFVVNAILTKQIILPTAKDKNKLMNWKDYYAYRNDILYCKKYGKNIFVKHLTPILLWIDLTLRAIYRRKFKNFKVINKAFKDGYTSKTGRTVNPGDF